MTSTRNRGAFAAVLAAALVVGFVSAGAAPASAAGPTVVTRAALAPALVAGRGADLGYQEQEAEKVDHNGTVLGPNRNPGTVAAEASGRSAVRLTGGQWVEFTLPAAANAITVRYSIPDSAGGGGITSNLNVRAASDPVQVMTLTSKYAWQYGKYPFVNTPSSGSPAHVFEEQRMLLGKTYSAGEVVRLTMPTESAAASMTIDLLDSHLVPAAAARPSGAISVVDHGADATGAGNSGPAFTAAIAAAKTANVPVWIPSGTFRVNTHLVLDNVRITGAGSWYSIVFGTQGTPSSPTADGSKHTGIGFYGKYEQDGGSSNVHLSGFTIRGDVAERIDNDQVNGIGGALSNSTIDGLYIENTKVGIWLDGPMTNVQIRNTVIVDQMADGVNFRRGVTDSAVTNSFFRNTGDDALAMWAHLDQNAQNTFAQNTVQSPTLANGIALYGGNNITIRNNLIADPLREGSGIHLGTRFTAQPFAGTTTITDNTVVRAGILGHGIQPGTKTGLGAIWFALQEGSISGVQVRGDHYLDSSYNAIMVMTTSNTAGRTLNAAFANIRVDGTGTSVLSARSAGAVSFTNVDARNVGALGVNNCGTTNTTAAASNFTVTGVSGNDGGWLSSPGCAATPTVVAPPAPSTWVQP